MDYKQINFKPGDKNNSKSAIRFVEGTAVSCILMPNTYHWYHAPVSGKIIESTDDVTDEYFGIKDFPDLLRKGDVGYGYDYSVFEHFRRGDLIIEGEKIGIFNTTCSVLANVKWVDSRIKINATDTVEVRYNGGTWTANPDTGMVDANGNNQYKAKPGYTLPGENEGALCGRIGDNGTVFLVGNVRQLPQGESGNLYFCINDDLARCNKQTSTWIGSGSGQKADR